MDDLILVLDEEDLKLNIEDTEYVFVDSEPFAFHYDEYSGSYEVTPLVYRDITLYTIGKLMSDNLVIKALPVDPVDAAISGSNTVTPSVSVTGSNVTLASTDTGISITAVGGGTASANVSATATSSGYVTEDTVLDTKTISASNASTSATLYIQSVSVPSGKSLEITNSGNLSATVGGNISIGETSVVSGGSWVTNTPTGYGTFYGKTIIDSTHILQAAFPVGSLYATETSTDNPSTILGFGTWTKYAPKDLTWDDSEISWAESVGVTDEVYVWKRTA